MIDPDQLLNRLERMHSAISNYARAKADRVQLEHFRKSKKALLMRSEEASTLPTAVQREQYAYAHPEYLQVINGLRDAVEIEEKHRWALEQLRMSVDVFRTIQANERAVRDRV